MSNSLRLRASVWAALRQGCIPMIAAGQVVGVSVGKTESVMVSERTSQVGHCLGMSCSPVGWSGMPREAMSVAVSVRWTLLPRVAFETGLQYMPKGDNNPGHAYHSAYAEVPLLVVLQQRHGRGLFVEGGVAPGVRVRCRRFGVSIDGYNEDRCVETSRSYRTLPRLSGVDLSRLVGIGLRHRAGAGWLVFRARYIWTLLEQPGVERRQPAAFANDMHAAHQTKMLLLVTQRQPTYVFGMSGKSPKAKAKATSPKKKLAKRSEPESFRARTLSVSLTVRDLMASVAWYQTVLGFTKGKEYAWSGKVGAVQLKAGSVEIVLNQDDGAKGFDRVKGEGFSIQFTTAQEIDGIARWAKDAGATLGTEPATAPWGARFFRITDPDGFKLVIST